MVRGMFLNVHLVMEVKHGVTLVPEEAIQLYSEGALVWVIKPDQTASRRPVRMGARDRGKVEILSGLSSGELVVTDGAFSLREGQKITYKLVEKGGAANAHAAAAPDARATPELPAEPRKP